MEYRKKQWLNEDWKTAFREKEGTMPDMKSVEWISVELPHNWEDYQGYRCLSHGNLHGTAWYFKRFQAADVRHCFIQFEGAGSYMKLWCNGIYIGEHKGGRTCYTAELTEALKPGEENLLVVETSHPEKIMDLPWVCGGCFGTPNTEGSQPLGIFRPVSLYQTGEVRVEPFGVAVTCERSPDGTVRINADTEVKNLSGAGKEIRLQQEVYDSGKRKLTAMKCSAYLEPGETRILTLKSEALCDYELWELEHPVLYEMHTVLYNDTGEISDELTDTFGIRFLEWENFGEKQEEYADPTLLEEEPTEENHFFVELSGAAQAGGVRILPGGVKVTGLWEEQEGVVLETATELLNDTENSCKVWLDTFIATYNRTKSIADMCEVVELAPGERKTIVQRTQLLLFPDFWTREEPYYHLAATTLRAADELLQKPMLARTPFGIHRKEGLLNKAYPYKTLEEEVQKPHRFFLNGKPVLINGTCEYENMLGCDHAFYEEQIHARMEQIQAAGFNSFREAHCPHNLRYLEYCEQHGLLYWAQMGAHLYFDREDFCRNYRSLTKEWVKERRNSPSVILWGLQNESMLPEAFASMLTDSIRALDITTSGQRKTTTCNGGLGSDWNIPQNWSGTYGGSAATYGEDIRRQALVGEYGQYRVLGKHEEGDMEARQNAGGDVSEELFCYCLGTKIREIEKQRDYVTGHFQWIFASHANPGRETLYCLDGKDNNAIGVVNSKGLLSCWGEPTDAFYMYRSYYTDGETQPMVYIVSHTWTGRLEKDRNSLDITVYSNCGKVELYGDDGKSLLGTQKKGMTGEPFVFRNLVHGQGAWKQGQMLYAIGYMNGEPAAEDRIIFGGCQTARLSGTDSRGREAIVLPANEEYLYRINCGGYNYHDVNGNLWQTDKEWDGMDYGWRSWAEEYENLPNAFGSKGICRDYLSNTQDQELFQTYRYGRQKLKYFFRVTPGSYQMELYFTEPWYGVGGGMKCEKWRLFDVAVNGETVFRDVDIWKEAGHGGVCRKTTDIIVKGDEICLSFPKIKSGQAVINAIALRKREK